MILTAILSSIITLETTLIFVMRSKLIEKRSQCRELQRKTDNLRGDVDAHRYREEQYHIREAYDRGLNDGRTTDELYRRMLRKYARGEQVTLLLGKKED